MFEKDLRPPVTLSLRGRRLAHWTPRYAYNRLRKLVRARMHPDEPSLTAQATETLEQLLRPCDRGVEWGSGNSTRWFARRTAHLTSFETFARYHRQVAESLRREGLTNVDYRLVPFEDQDDEEAMHRTDWVRSAHAFEDGSLDYVLVDSSPRGCLCAAIAPKLKAGGLLILDNANWYIPPPAGVQPPAPGSVAALLGTPGSPLPANRCWPAFARLSASWRPLWSSDGIQMTLILVKALPAAEIASYPV